MIDNSKMMIGEHFTYRGIEWICLDIIDGNYLAITAQVWEELPFDNDSKNNWKESSLRRVLNDEFLGKLNLVLATTSETYAADLQNNKDKLNVWWRCNVEYDNGKVGYDYPCNRNGKKPRKVIFVNGRLIYADYNFSIEGVENVCDTLEEMFDIDFKSNEQPKELFEQDKAYKNYMRVRKE